MGAPKLKKDVFQKVKKKADNAKLKKEAEQIKKKINSLIEKPENAKKAAMIIEKLINNNKK